MAKGQRASRHIFFRRAHEAVIHSLSYAYRHRRELKGDMRRLWIVRISAAARAQGITYGQFICGLKESGIGINRKMLADLAIKEPEALSQLITLAKGKVAGAAQ